MSFLESCSSEGTIRRIAHSVALKGQTVGTCKQISLSPNGAIRGGSHNVALKGQIVGI